MNPNLAGDGAQRDMETTQGQNDCTLSQSNLGKVSPTPTSKKRLKPSNDVHDNESKTEQHLGGTTTSSEQPKLPESTHESNMPSSKAKELEVEYQKRLTKIKLAKKREKIKALTDKQAKFKNIELASNNKKETAETKTQLKLEEIELEAKLKKEKVKADNRAEMNGIDRATAVEKLEAHEEYKIKLEEIKLAKAEKRVTAATDYEENLKKIRQAEHEKSKADAAIKNSTNQCRWQVVKYLAFCMGVALVILFLAYRKIELPPAILVFGTVFYILCAMCLYGGNGFDSDTKPLIDFSFKLIFGCFVIYPIYMELKGMSIISPRTPRKY